MQSFGLKIAILGKLKGKFGNLNTHNIL